MLIPRRPRGRAELDAYRDDLLARTARIDTVVADAADMIDALRRRDVDVDRAVDQLTLAEEELDGAADELRVVLAPAELHPLHVEYEANLERALRGIVTAQRGCGLTRQPHRPPEDEEPFTYWKRGHLNIVHARLRMGELVAALVEWEPGRQPTSSVGARLRRS